MICNFDKIINRINSDSEKWSYYLNFKNNVEETNLYRDKDAISMWVADMDFESPKEVLEGLSKRVKHGVFGYSETNSSYYNAVVAWMKKRHNWDILSNWICLTPGVVNSLMHIVNIFTEKGDAVMIQPPVYRPFFFVVEGNDRKLVKNSLLLSTYSKKYVFDYDNFEDMIVKNKVKLFILCNPHNPVGRVWNKEELSKIGEICVKYNVLIVSDEIHCDLVYKGAKFIPFASISKDFSNNCIICSAASKTFNLPGFHASNIIIPNDKIREIYKTRQRFGGVNGVDLLGKLATELAYTHCEYWLNELILYLQENISTLNSFISKYIPKIKIIKPEGTYLVWLDFREFNLSDRELFLKLHNDARVTLNNGLGFGEEGSGFQRMNIATPRPILTKALERLRESFS